MSEPNANNVDDEALFVVRQNTYLTDRFSSAYVVHGSGDDPVFDDVEPGTTIKVTIGSQKNRARIASELQKKHPDLEILPMTHADECTAIAASAEAMLSGTFFVGNRTVIINVGGSTANVVPMGRAGTQVPNKSSSYVYADGEMVDFLEEVVAHARRDNAIILAGVPTYYCRRKTALPGHGPTSFLRTTPATVYAELWNGNWELPQKYHRIIVPLLACLIGANKSPIFIGGRPSD